MQTVAELTQLALTKLRSNEFSMRVVQLSPGPTAAAPVATSASEIDMAAAIWRNRYGSSAGHVDGGQMSLPPSLVDYFKALQTDGLNMAISVPRMAGSGKPYGLEASAIVATCRLNRIADIVPVAVDGHQLAAPHAPRSPTESGPSSSASQRATAPSVRCFVLSSSTADATGAVGGDGSRSTLCDVLLVYRERGPLNNPEVWGRHPLSGELFYLCRTVEDYLRLSCRFYWILGWQCCFYHGGPPEWSVPWMRMLCPGPLLAALRT